MISLEPSIRPATTVQHDANSRQVSLFPHLPLTSIVNQATILGRVGQDAELNNVGNDRSVVHFSVATSESKTDAEGMRLIFQHLV